MVQKFSQRKVYGEVPTPRLRFILRAIEQRKRTAFDDSVMATLNALNAVELKKYLREHGARPAD